MITHIVHFAYKPEIASNERQLLASRFLLLLESCQRDGQPYILSLTGGKQNSKEGVDKGLEHSFVVVFASEEDRDYYVDKDPVHQAFKDRVGPSVADVVVMDFEDGVF